MTVEGKKGRWQELTVSLPSTLGQSIAFLGPSAIPLGLVPGRRRAEKGKLEAMIGHRADRPSLRRGTPHSLARLDPA